MSFLFNAVENQKNNWTIIVNGCFSDNSKCYHNKKVKYKGVLNEAIQKTVQVLNLGNEQYKLDQIKTIKDQKELIEFNRQPIPKLYNKLNLSTINAEFNLVDNGKMINFFFSKTLVDHLDDSIRYSFGGSIDQDFKITFKTFMHTDSIQAVKELTDVQYRERGQIVPNFLENYRLELVNFVTRHAPPSN